jgi:hypothetical protein
MGKESRYLSRFRSCRDHCNRFRFPEYKQRSSYISHQPSNRTESLLRIFNHLLIRFDHPLPMFEENRLGCCSTQQCLKAPDHDLIELSSYLTKTSVPFFMSILASRTVQNPTSTNSAFGWLEELAKPAA